jgi:Family of unknown function (DUF5706)
MANPGDLDGRDRVTVAEELIATMRAEAARADGQAATMLGAAGVVVGVVLAATLAGQWSPGRLPVAARVLWWPGVLAGVAALGLFAAAICPRLPARAARRRPPVALHHAWDVLAAYAAGDVTGALTRTATGDLAAAAGQLVVVARIVDRKFRTVRAGLRLLGVAGLLLVAAAAALAVTR